MSHKGFFAAFCAVLVFAVGASAAAAGRGGPATCTGGDLAGPYASLVVTGHCTVQAGTTLTVTGNLTVAPGAYLDAFTMGTVTVGGNILVGRDSVLALGCTLTSLSPGEPTPCTGTTNDVVGGNIVATHAQTMYLDGDTIKGNVISTGGGPGPTFDPYVNFPIKDNVIYGNVVVEGWQGAWFGFLRNTTYGNVILSRNAGVAIGDLGTLDSTEVAGNTLSGNLICLANSPAAQFGDIPPFFSPDNVVGGNKIGECAGL